MVSYKATDHMDGDVCMISLNRRSNVGFEVLWQGVVILLLACVIGLAVNQVRPGGLALVADWSPKAQLTTDSGISLEIPLEDTEALFFARMALFLDARSPELFTEGHIQGAVNLPWDAFDAIFPRVMAGVPHDTTIVTYCDGDTCGLSKDLALALLQEGYFNVRVLVNGWTRWQQSNLPVEIGVERP
jgi:rhodanese-related sulfurtransferase